MVKVIIQNCFFQEVLLFPAMKPDDPNKHTEENAADKTVENGA